MSDIEIERAGPIATLILNRPHTRNAVTLAMYEELPDVVAGIDADPVVKVIILRGAGERAFAAGADISEFGTVRADASSARNYNARIAAAERSLERASKPIIAMIHGYCIGGGCGLALACDIRFADENARFAITPSKLGIVYSLESTKRLSDLVGPARAKWMLMSGEQIGGEHAVKLGLVDELHPAADLRARTYDFAELLCSRAQSSVRAAKTVVNLIRSGQSADSEATTELRNSSFDGLDYAEGVAAFLAKRNPRFP